MRPPADDLIEQLLARTGDAELVAAVEAVYADLTDAVGAEGPTCELSGRCCNFQDWDHRLYVSSPEIVHFVSSWRDQLSPQQRYRAWKQTVRAAPDGPESAPVCPLQIGRICGVHGVRPLGCRLFFCEAGAEKWGRPLYETLHERLRNLCETHSLPYAYVEWTQVLGSLIEGGSLNPAHAKGYGYWA